MKQSEYFKTEKFKVQLEKARVKGCWAAGKVSHEAYLKRVEEYNKNPKYCHQCKATLEYGKSKFCNSSCSARFSNKNRGSRSEETKRKISEAVKLTTIKNKKPKVEFCSFCMKEFIKTPGNSKLCSDECRKKYHKNIIDSKIANGTFSGWKSRTKLEPSYPEKYFIEVLNNLKVPYQREYKIGKFFADFLITENLVLEIDGHQHKMPDRKERDQRKDKFLIENGYKVFRIDWYNPTNEDRKTKLYSQINNLKEWLVQNLGPHVPGGETPLQGDWPVRFRMDPFII